MKRIIIFSTILSIAVMTGSASAQFLNFTKVMLKQDLDPSGNERNTITFTGLEVPDLQIFESIVPVSSDDECLATTELVNPRLLGPTRAKLLYNASTASYTLQWIIPKERSASCRVLKIATSASTTSGYNTWRTNFGRTAFADDEATKEDSIGLLLGDGSVRHIPPTIAIAAIY
jgi:hypothetical protein